MANIFKIAKTIQRKHPRMAWADCVSAAGRQMKSPKRKKAARSRAKPKKKSMPRKTKARRPAAKKPTGRKTKRLTAAHFKARAKDMLEQDLGKLVVKHFNATKKSIKRKVQKSITAKKAEIRKLK